MSGDATPRRDGAASALLTSLRRGRSYDAVTVDGIHACGEFCGVEVCHGERAILLSSGGAFTSIALSRLASVEPTATA